MAATLEETVEGVLASIACWLLSAHLSGADWTGSEELPQVKVGCSTSVKSFDTCSYHIASEPGWIFKQLHAKQQSIQATMTGDCQLLSAQ